LEEAEMLTTLQVKHHINDLPLIPPTQGGVRILELAWGGMLGEELRFEIWGVNFILFF